MNRKQILVTGASRGIGKACAIHFAKEGWHVFLNCRKSISELQATADFITKETSGSCEILPGDVGVPSEVGRIFDQIEMSGSGLDVLINNAGIAWMGLLTDMSIEEWNRMISTNLSSAFYCCRAALPYMIHQKAGRIINISSMWGTVGASCEVAYSATKSGLNGLTRALAKELAPSNIQVNAIACGVIDTVMNDLGCGRKSCPRRRNPCRTFRDTRRSRASRMAACKCPSLSYRADTGYGRRIYLTPTPRSCPTSRKV